MLIVRSCHYFLLKQSDMIECRRAAKEGGIWVLSFEKQFRIDPTHLPAEKNRILRQARDAMQRPIAHITDVTAPLSEGTIHDFYSNGDYWWPDPEKADGLPYIQRDGQTNPDNFIAHRLAMRQMRTDVVSLSIAYALTGDPAYANHGVRILEEFFLDPKTRMNPNLNYAQAIPGICAGRGIGIIDTLHLIEVPFAIERLKRLGGMTERCYAGLKDWFAEYLGWMLTSSNGIQEMNAANNHGVCFFAQAAVFALFTDNQLLVDFCRQHYKKVLLEQMDADGSFPRELARTKPYNYSIFVIDNMVTLCYLLSTPKENLWEYPNQKGADIRKGLDFITPYLIDKSLWPYPKDVMYFEDFPVRSSFLVFAGCVLGREELLELYQRLPYPFTPEEVSRNNAIQEPVFLL